MYIDVKIVELPLLHHPAYSLVTTHCGSHNGTANGPHGWSRPPANNHAVYSMQSGWRGKYSFGNTYNLDFVFDISVLCGAGCMHACDLILPSSLHQYSYWYCSSEGDFKMWSADPRQCANSKMFHINNFSSKLLRLREQAWQGWFIFFFAFFCLLVI